MILGSWIKAAGFVAEKNALKLAAMAGTSVIGLAKTQPNGHTGYGNALQSKVAEVAKANQTKARLINQGVYRRSEEEIIADDIERKMFALRAYILSFVELGEDGYFHITDGSTNQVTDDRITCHIDRYADTLEVRCDKLFQGTRVPLDGPCFRVTGCKIMPQKNPETGAIEEIPVPIWQKTLDSMIHVNPVSGMGELWFTWPKFG